MASRENWWMNLLDQKLISQLYEDILILKKDKQILK